MSSDRNNLMGTLIQIATLYYLEDHSQQEIADELGVSRSLVALYLKKARDQGIIRFSIINPQDNLEDLACGIQELAGLHHVVVVPSSHNSSTLTRRSLAGVVARHLEDTLKDGDVIGLGWGRTVAEVINLLAPSKPRLVDVVPLLGESSSGISGSFSQINQMVMNTAHAFNGRAHFLLVPLLVSSNALRTSLYEDEAVKGVSSLWDHLDYAVMGVGSIVPQDGEVVYIGPENLSMFEQQGAVGDVVVRYFNIQGSYIQTDFHDRLIGIDLPQLTRAKHRIALASGIEKARATVGVLRSGVCTDLFVDEILARAVLEELSSAEKG